MNKTGNITQGLQAKCSSECTIILRYCYNYYSCINIICNFDHHEYSLRYIVCNILELC